MSELVARLTNEQNVEFSSRPEPTLEAFQAAIDRGYVHIRFAGSRGATELGVKLDMKKSDLAGANLAAGTGSVEIVGDLVLDYVPVRLFARIDLPALKGVGRLERQGD
jgi:hypothetical protein